MSWGTPTTFSQASHNVALAFTTCLCRAERSASDASLAPSQVFSECTSGPGHEFCTTESPVFLRALQNPYFSIYLPPQPPPSQAFWSICCFPIHHPLPTAAMGSMLSTDATWEATAALKDFQGRQHKDTPLCWSLRGTK